MFIRRIVENRTLRDFLLIIGVFITGIGIFFSAQQTQDNAQQTKLLAQQTEEAKNQLELSRKINSAQLVDTIMQRIDDPKFETLGTAIEGDGISPHQSSYRIWNKYGGKFTHLQITYYINNFDELGNLYESGLIDNRMAYNEFAYDAEKTWCNNDIQKLINSDRQTDPIPSGYHMSWWGFEQITKYFLKEDHIKQCSEINNE